MELSFKIRCINQKFDPTERNPFIKCYLDGRFHRRAVKVPASQEIRTVKVNGKLRDGHEIDQRTALCFASAAWRPNDMGVQCMMETGVTHIEFGTIEQAIRKQGKYHAVHPLIMHTVGGVHKGDLEITIERLSVRFQYTNDQIGDSAAIGSAVKQYVDQVLSMEQQMPETFGPQTSNMRIPYNMSEAGLQSSKNGVPLPAVSYIMSETPETNDLYWINAMCVVMNRDNLTPKDWYRLNTIGKARATAHTLCYIIQDFDYAGDTVMINGQMQPCEIFGDALAFKGNDCEDQGGGIDQCKKAFDSHQFTEVRSSEGATHLDLSKRFV